MQKILLKPLRDTKTLTIKNKQDRQRLNKYSNLI